MNSFRYFSLIFILAGLALALQATERARVRLNTIMGHMQSIKPVRFPELAQRPAGATREYLKHALLNEQVRKAWGPFISKHPGIINAILQREEDHEKTHHVVYHAQHWCFRVLQDFLWLLYEYEFKETPRSDYIFLRWWHRAAHDVNAQAFLDRLGGTVKDNIRAIFDVLLSVNFALFGNTTMAIGGECTFDYFLSNRSIAFNESGLRNLIQEILAHYNFDTAYADKLIALSKDIATPEGTLFQIFVDDVDASLYISQPGGTPHEQIKTKLFGIVAPKDFDPIKKRYVRSAGVLNARNTQATSIAQSQFDEMQGRLLLNKHFMNPQDNKIKIYRYTTIPADKRTKYAADLKALFAEMVSKKSAAPAQITSKL